MLLRVKAVPSIHLCMMGGINVGGVKNVIPMSITYHEHCLIGRERGAADLNVKSGCLLQN